MEFQWNQDHRVIKISLVYWANEGNFLGVDEDGMQDIGEIGGNN